MKAIFKSSTISTPLELIAGLNINAYGTTPKKITARKISLTSDSDTEVDIYIQATNLADNSTTTRHLAYSVLLAPGNVVEVLESGVSFTGEYFLYISKSTADGVKVDVYCEYEELDDSPFVKSFTV